jgi:hypothetical protein
MTQPEIDANIARLESGKLFYETGKHVIGLFLKTWTSFAPTPVIVRILGGYVRDGLLGFPIQQHRYHCRKHVEQSFC